MLLSIIIPTYIDEERSLDRLKLCIKAFDCQTQKDDYEIIVVDDGSKIHVSSFLKMNNFKNFRIVRKKHSGLASAYNYGVNIARGERIFLGVDDNIPHRDAVKNIFQTIKHYDESYMLMGNEINLMFVTAYKEIITPKYFDGIDVDKHKKEFSLEIEKFPGITENDIENRLSELFELGKVVGNYAYFEKYISDLNNSDYHWICWRPGAIVISKAKYLEIGGYDEEFDPSNWYSDIEFGYRAHKKGLKLVFESQIKFLHLNHSKFFRSHPEEKRCFDYMAKKHKDIKLAMMPFLWSRRDYVEFTNMLERIDELFKTELREISYEN